MRAKILTATLLTGALMTACATQQENPHYRHSSKAPTKTAPVQYADSQTQNVAPVVYRQDVPSHQYSTQNTSFPAPSSVPVTIEASAPAPLPYTPEAAPVASSQMVETGGQNAGVWGENMTPEAITEPTMAPMVLEPTPLDPPKTFSTPSAAPQVFAAPSAAMTEYLVQEDDTVYSLSRARCVSTNEVAAINGLDAAFTIKAGAYIKLPASRC